MAHRISDERELQGKYQPRLLLIELEPYLPPPDDGVLVRFHEIWERASHFLSLCLWSTSKVSTTTTICGKKKGSNPILHMPGRGEEKSISSRMGWMEGKQNPPKGTFAPPPFSICMIVKYQGSTIGGILLEVSSKFY